MPYQDLLKQISSQTQTLSTPVRKLGKLMVDNTEKFAQIQLEFARSYRDLGFEQLRAAFGVSDAQSLQAYLSAQSKLAETLSDKLARDTRTLVTMGEHFGADLQKLAKENAALLSEVAQPKPRAKKAA